MRALHPSVAIPPDLELLGESVGDECLVLDGDRVPLTRRQLSTREDFLDHRKNN